MLPKDEYYDKHDELNEDIVIHENSYEDPYDDDNYSHDYDDEYENERGRPQRSRGQAREGEGNDVGSFYNDFISAEKDGLNDSLVCNSFEYPLLVSIL